MTTWVMIKMIKELRHNGKAASNEGIGAEWLEPVGLGMGSRWADDGLVMGNAAPDSSRGCRYHAPNVMR